jgi:hypothetical protein
VRRASEEVDQAAVSKKVTHTKDVREIVGKGVESEEGKERAYMSREHIFAPRAHGMGELQDCGGMAVHWWLTHQQAYQQLGIAPLIQSPRKLECRDKHEKCRASLHMLP